METAHKHSTQSPDGQAEDWRCPVCSGKWDAHDQKCPWHGLWYYINFGEDHVHVDQLHMEVKGDSDRSLAILFGAEIEEQLRLLLEHVLLPERHPGGGKHHSWNLKRASFDEKIELANRMGILRPDLHYEDLHLVRRIRNEFAHGTKGMSFAHSTVASLCRNLRYGGTGTRVESGRHWTGPQGITCPCKGIGITLQFQHAEIAFPATTH